jgi:putative mRNA 3-end processing factor
MLLEFTDRGIYCPPADVYIDPWRPVPRALITHGHSDHARWGHGAYLCTPSAAPVIRYRLGDIRLETLDYGHQRAINGVNFSFHPAGHIVGSAQIRVEHRGEVWVVSGDYKLENDGLAEPFEPVACHTFITESTFGLPIYRWAPQQAVMREINDWWRTNQAAGKTSVLFAYALGKAQRLLAGLDTSIGTIYTHGAVENTNKILREQGVVLPRTVRVNSTIPKQSFPGNMVIAVPSALGSPWLRKFQPAALGYASGWMQMRGTRRRRSVDRGFVMSDHADWAGLNTAVQETGAERVFVTHGYTETFARWLREQGLEAGIVKTAYEGEQDAE